MCNTHICAARSASAGLGTVLNEFSNTTDGGHRFKRVVVKNCQICGSQELDPVLFLGYLPPVNQMWPIGHTPGEQPAYPALLFRCRQCQLVQFGLVVDPQILFPPEYPYSSGTTKILRENFAELCREATPLLGLRQTT